MFLNACLAFMWRLKALCNEDYNHVRHAEELSTNIKSDAAIHTLASPTQWPTASSQVLYCEFPSRKSYRCFFFFFFSNVECEYSTCSQSFS